MRSAADLLEEFNAVDGPARIEAKRASELGKSVMQSVIAFANGPGLHGGYLLLGVPMVRDGQLRFRYPESAKHPHQAFVAPVDTEEQL